MTTHKEVLTALVHEMEYVLSCINADKVPFDGDDFHEALRLGKEALAQPEQEPVAIHQFRSPYSSDWYDGVPDHHDGHGPYEVRTLYTTPPQPKEPEQEPVAFELYHHICLKLAEAGCKLSEQQKMALCNLKAVTTPPQRTWEGLSVFEINDLVENTEYEDYRGLVERTEAKLKGKNT